MKEKPIVYCGICTDRFCFKGKGDGRQVFSGTSITPDPTRIEDCEIREEAISAELSMEDEFRDNGLKDIDDWEDISNRY